LIENSPVLTMPDAQHKLYKAYQSENHGTGEAGADRAHQLRGPRVHARGGVSCAGTIGAKRRSAKRRQGDEELD